MVPKKDLLIIAELRKNARESLTDMSRKIRIPISTIYDRLKLNEGSLIKKHTTLIDFSKLGFYTRANILIKVEHDSKESLKEFLLRHHRINSVFQINNGYDFLAEGIFKHIKELEDFCEDMESKFRIQKKDIYYIIEEIKRESFLADAQIVELIQKDIS
ncbi:MAG: Lrp/AsnC family transcriptional regulator [Candidatus Woesearchaeota archaeon]